MKIKSIAAICKKNKNIAIFERYSDDGDILTQYIGDGSAVYPVVGLPQLDKESLLTIFDVPEKDRDNYFVKTLGVPAGISFEDTDETERHVEREGISIIYSGRTLKPIRTTRGLVFIESRYLSPVADVLDVLELYERRTAEGTPYIVAKAGFLLQAVIMPYDVINQQFVESLQDLTRECEFSLSEKERREREARDRFAFTEPEQCSLNVDPDARSASGFKRLSRKRGGGYPIVLLIPARTDTAYFHDYIYGKAEIRFVRGRLRFTDDDGNAADPAPFPSMVVIYNGERVKE